MRAHVRRQRVRKFLLLIAFLFFPLTFYYYSPVVVLAAAAAGVASGSLILFCAQFLCALWLGRAFCGWACPVGALCEWLVDIRDRSTGGRGDWLKWLIWVPWVSVLILLVTRAGGLEKVEPLYMMSHGIPLGEWSGVVAYLAVLGLVVALSLLAGRRAFCHYICWMAPGMILATRAARAIRLPSLHLVGRAEACTACGRCDAICPMSLPVSAMVLDGDVRHDECVLCHLCVDNCPRSAIDIRCGVSGLKS